MIDKKFGELLSWKGPVPEDRVRAWEGDIPIESLYTVGVAAEKCLRALKDEGKLLGPFCPKCQTILFPPQIFCERCFSEPAEWRELPATGEVAGVTTVVQDRTGAPVAPRTLAWIRFPGVWGGIIHYLKVDDPAKAKPGLTVKPVLKPAGERTGSILDICHFEPA